MFAAFALVFSGICVAETNRPYLMGNYSYFDLLAPGKWGLSAGISEDDSHAWELEYLKGSISGPWVMEDLGSVQDTRISLIRRSNIWFDTFNVGYGLSYFDFKIYLGNEILDSVSDNAPSVDVASSQAVGTYFSVGNRFEFAKNWIFGIDWFSWSQPWVLIDSKSDFLGRSGEEEERELVRDALNLVHQFPRLAAFKLQLGRKF